MLCFADPASYHHDFSSKDPLWHSRSMLENTLSKKSMIIAIRTRLSALDEHSTATKAWTEAKIYNAHKPSKFAVHFYAVTELINLYFSLFFAIIQEIKHVYVVLLTQWLIKQSHILILLVVSFSSLTTFTLDTI